MTNGLGLLSREQLRRQANQARLKSEKLRALHEIGSAIAFAFEVETVLTRVVEAACFITNAEEASLLLLDEETKELYLRAQKGLGEKYARGFTIRTDDSLAGGVVKTGKPHRLASKSKDLKVVTGYMVNAIVYIPVVIRGMVVGVLCVDNKVADRSFTEDDENMLSILAGYTAIILDNARLLEDNARLLKELDRKAQVLADMYGLDQLESLPQVDLQTVGVVLYPNPELASSDVLNPQHLTAVINPYLTTIANIQHLVDEIEGKSPSKVRILAITHNLPTIASVEGVRQAVEVINRMVVPRKRELGQLMEQLLVKEKEVAVEKAQAEALEARARVEKDGDERERLLAEAAKQHAKVEELNWESEHSRRELQQNKIQLALDFVMQINPDLSNKETIAYVVRLLPGLEHIITSPLQVSTAQAQGRLDATAKTIVQPDVTRRRQAA